ncbi:tetratricopeptide repeat protein [Thermomicrobiaceae bacterium CFH 74404]|uniref:Tetratricopeptide repeat protein n=1 Tax=Thermalbibacter longus TaxID=2951981 RepID=A0AA41WC58_9BACT|nr:tetratricopeptide repeat protein [Thermalbibacter longus]MCM8747535.1 tetratricopeptide repeat protein [Thermalbibacter longus]
MDATPAPHAGRQPSSSPVSGTTSGHSSHGQSIALDPVDVLHALWCQTSARATGQTDLLVTQTRQALIRGATALALDTLLLTEALNPDRIETYVTHAELALALGKHDLAEALLGRLERLASLNPGLLDALDLRRLRLHLGSTVDELLAFGKEILATGRSDLWTAYLPPIIRILQQSGRIGEALELARSWHTTSGASVTAWWTYARQVLEAGETSPAQELLTALPRAPVDAHQWAILLGLSSLVGDQHELSVLRQALNEVRSGRLAALDLDRELERLSGAGAWSRPVELYRALIWLAAGEPQRAIDLALPLEGSESASTRLLGHAVAAWAGLASPRPEQALPHLQAAFQLLAETPNLTDELAELLSPLVNVQTVGKHLAALLQQRGQVDEAIETLRRLVDLNPTRADLRYQLAELMAQAGRIEEAREMLQAFAQEQQAKRDFRGRLETLRHLVQLTPEGPTALEELITGYTRIGMMEQAIALLEQLAAAAAPRRRDAAVELLRRAAELAMLGQQWGAIPRIYEQLIGLDPDNLDHRHAAVTAYIQTGQLRQAIEQLREIVRVALARGEPEEALAALHQVVALDPRNPDAYHRLAELLVSLGELEQAERVYRRLLALYPDDQVARAKQAALAALLKPEDGNPQ